MLPSAAWDPGPRRFHGAPVGRCKPGGRGRPKRWNVYIATTVAPIGNDILFPLRPHYFPDVARNSVYPSGRSRDEVVPVFGSARDLATSN